MHRIYSLAAVVLLAAGSAAALAGNKPPAATSPSPKQPLDLSAPPINLVLTPEQVQAMVADRADDAPPPEVVTVKKHVYQDPVPVGTFRALPWALMHPLQAWRIFAPITDD